jgi:hypothetical protein
MMRVVKLLVAVLMMQLIVSCSSKSQPEPSLAGKWKITSAVGNDDLHWTGSFTLTQNGGSYNGLFTWDSADGQQSGTDSVTGTYDTKTRVLTLNTVAVTGNIQSVKYTADVSASGTSMTGIWTGSTDGTIAHPGHWTAEKQ